MPSSDLLPIDVVARRLGMRASAIRYYEQRGLVEPADQRSGKRWYGPDEIRRLAIIRYWQDCGLLSLDRIAELLAGPDGSAGWAETVEAQIGELTDRIERMVEARDQLRHVLDHHPDTAPDGCPHYESLIWDRRPPLRARSPRRWGSRSGIEWHPG